ncbi:DUF3606 domain-containing protein [Ramlibacter sp. Leaf400]|uniref:DUF3606 domain-containing protein n=1 Tax=Ramlibacter sp. Leaf400 TaxID=1736365 RepID=UPI0006F277B0|nr:DUF3606 domain-containing protein [Ramlibacter sp. Leaf400]KQT12512.1 hypothetical protein ASG30_02585 [Ramlibacter sp. Leaf400]
MDKSTRPGEEPDRINIEDPKDRAEWARKLDCSEAQLREAVKAVGDEAGAVEMHLHGVHSTTNSDRVHELGDD